MFIGHYAIGLGAKKYAPAVSLGSLFIAVQFLDLLWPSLLLLNIEHVGINDPGSIIPLSFTDYPVSHSLVMVLLWSAIAGLVTFLIRRDIKTAFVIGLAVTSHWFLDLLVHIPDLPLWPGNSPLLGLSLWTKPLLSLLVEVTLFVWGSYIYIKNTQAANRSGKIGLWLLLGLLAVIYVANLFGPRPEDVSALAWGAQLQWIFVFLAFWVDHNRVPKNQAQDRNILQKSAK